MLHELVTIYGGPELELYKIIQKSIYDSYSMHFQGKFKSTSLHSYS